MRGYAPDRVTDVLLKLSCLVAVRVVDLFPMGDCDARLKPGIKRQRAEPVEQVWSHQKVCTFDGGARISAGLTSGSRLNQPRRTNGRDH